MLAKRSREIITLKLENNNNINNNIINSDSC